MALAVGLVGCATPVVDTTPTETPRITDRGTRDVGGLRLRVEARAAERGDAVALLGGGAVVCAARHEADVACFGKVGLFDPALSEHAGAPEVEVEPVALSGFRQVVAMAAGRSGRCLVEANGRASCWGDRFAWGAGFEPLAPQPWPAGRVAALSVGQGAYAVVDDGLVRRGAAVCRAEQIGGIRDAVLVAAGEDVACVVDRDGALWCWDGECTGAPARVEALAGVVQIAAGTADVCARTGDGRVWCAGKVVAIERAVDIAAAGGRACALRDDGAVYCWALGDSTWTTGGARPRRVGGRAMGDGPRSSAMDRPRRVEGLGASIDLVVMDDRACALGLDREVVCIGATPGPRITAAQWQASRPLWPGRSRDEVVLDGAVQGFRAAAGDALGELQFRLDRYCGTHDCTQSWPPARGPTVTHADDTLRGWPELSPTDDPIDVFAGAEVTATADGSAFVLGVAYAGDALPRPIALHTTCRPQPRASFRHVSCDGPKLRF